MQGSVEHILEEIVRHKKSEVAELADAEVYLHELKRQDIPCKGFAAALNAAKGPALIAECKKASPSKGVLKRDYDPVAIAEAYSTAGAHCVSVLTDSKFFQGTIKDLQVVSSKVKLPCIRKDFIIDKRQVVNSRLAGADAILLIAAILDDHKLKRFYNLALDLGMDVLVEVHDEADMEKALKINPSIIGINNRDLRSFEVDLNTSKTLVEKYKKDLTNKLIVSESGIRTNEQVKELYAAGIKAFLVGESLMTQSNQLEAVRTLLNDF